MPLSYGKKGGRLEAESKCDLPKDGSISSMAEKSNALSTDCYVILF